MPLREPDEPRMVYVGNLPWNLKWQELKDHMKAAGDVEFTRVLTQDGSDWGRSRGVGYVRYATEGEAKNAIATLNQSDIGGRQITVDAWTGGKPQPGGKGGKGFPFNAGFGKGYGGKGGQGKGYGKGFPPFGYMKGGWGFKGYGKQVKVHGEADQMVYIGNLPFKCEWQELKDLMKQAGTVEFVKILTEDGTDFSRSKGIACVRYATTEEATVAVTTLNGAELQGRKLTVDKWSRGGKGAKE